MTTVIGGDGFFSPIEVAFDSAIRRIAERPVELRQPEFDAEFDDVTIFYDAFFWKNGTEVRLIGPKFMNFLPYMKEAQVYIEEQEHLGPLAFNLHEKRKVGYMDILLPPNVGETLSLNISLGELGAFKVRPQKSGLDLFAGKRVAFTLFKYEPSHWLKDWAYFNAVYHKADALVVYHNNCEDRTTDEIAAALEDIPGIETLLVANWPYKYGPSDGGTGRWDSNFCQICMLEEMRWRFLQNARSVLHSDIDELLLTRDHRSIFEIVEADPRQYVQADGVWVRGKGKPPSQSVRRHKDFWHFAGGKVPDMEPKWAAVPGAFGEDQRWIVHRIGPAADNRLPQEEVSLRHFLPINTGWKVDRSEVVVGEADQQLLDAYKKVGWL